MQLVPGFSLVQAASPRSKSPLLLPPHFLGCGENNVNNKKKLIMFYPTTWGINIYYFSTSKQKKQQYGLFCPFPTSSVLSTSHL
jgi:hypothetical protein